MQRGKIIYPKKRGLSQEQKELAARGSYSVILVVVALFLIRPLMVSQILNRAEAYSAFGLFEDSKRQCNKVLLIDGNNSRAWCQLGHIYRAEGDLHMALEAYRRATEADPTNKPANYELAMMHLREGRHQEAITYFEQVRALGPDQNERLQQDGFSYHKSALGALIGCYEKVGDPDKARFTREELRVFYPDTICLDQTQTQNSPSPED
ncbi:MAG: tetratricopeptide repeat protein [Sedimentisphaerales bacterium]|nr:tetratricopeptide repeat protein [Sedimentisphaerales bacterium]